MASCQHRLWIDLNCSKSSNLDRHPLSLRNEPQRKTISHHWLAPSKTWDDTMSKAQAVPQLGPPAAVPTLLETLASRSARLAHGQQPGGKDKPVWTSPFPKSRFLIPMPSFSLPPLGSGSSEVSCLKFIRSGHKTLISVPEVILPLHHTIINS